MKLRGKTYFDLFWVVFFGAIFVTSLGLEFEAGLIPGLVSGICFIFGAANLIIEIRKQAPPKGEGGPVPGSHMAKGKVARKVAFRRFAAISCWLIGFVLGTYLFGHLVAIPLFTFLFLKAKRESWALSATYAVLLFAGVYLAIVVGVKTPLYTGLLPGLMGE